MSDHRPFVSVIVPAYNEADGIRDCIEALLEQTYPEDRHEVIVVDNGSTDGTADVAREYPATVLVEDETQGSYAARNRGIEHATGEVLAFTDADCTPDPGWIEAGVAALEGTGADLVAGRVRFEFSPERTAAERFDASVNMRNDESVRRGVAKTANVFARRPVVDAVGAFPDHLVSGGDVYWTKSATDAGFDLVYAPGAVVHHPARQFRSLLAKQYRVGKGQIQIWRLDDEPAGLILLRGLVRFPLKVLRFGLAGDEVGDSGTEPADRVESTVEKGFIVYLVAAVCVLAMNMGRVVGLFRQ